MDSRTKKTRVALTTYGVVLVLPTLVLGLLYWNQLQREYDAQLAAVPEEAEDAAQKVVDGLRTDLEDLLTEEQRRPFYHYAEVYALEEDEQTGGDLTEVRSPLHDRPPHGVLAYFRYELSDEPLAAAPAISVFGPSPSDGPSGSDERRLQALEGVDDALARFWRRKNAETLAERLDVLRSEASEVTLPVAAVAYWQGDAGGCVRSYFGEIRDIVVNCEVSDFTLDFFLEPDGTPRAFASRTVLLWTSRSDIPSDADCLDPIANELGYALRQGMILDVDWLFGRRPRARARDVLGKDQRLVEQAAEFPLPADSKRFAEILPVPALGFRFTERGEESFGKLEIESDTTLVEQRFARSKRRFLGVGLLLLVTLLTGMRLLYLNVRRELDQAHRMQNFVAAVTHELRTPLSAIRLHGEMLLDGWATDPAKQRDYYKRILRETERLSTLVERVLEKSRLKEDRVVPRPGDLNEVVAGLRTGLEAPEGGFDDLELQLGGELPPVLMTHEAVAGILSNLVENARKYAPVEDGGEPILVRTYRLKERVVLEVADRGPGVPAGEKERVFEAFYRSGTESTRQTIGTGLGLHLVQLHARSIGARASVEDRDGGGSAFRVAFRSAS